MLLPDDALPNPTILPPAVVVVRIQASTANVWRPCSAVLVEARPADVPSNDEAVSESSPIAPVRPRVTPEPTVRSDQPAQSGLSAPPSSPRRQYETGSSSSTVCAYDDSSPSVLTGTVIQLDRTTLPNGSTASRR